ncbi:MAG: 30S ribosomal protein S3 [Methanomicrobiales archaeon]
MIEKDFVTEGLRRTTIDEYLENELERAGYGGMEIQVTPLGTMVVVYAERPGMVIGRGGKTVRNITQNLKNNFGIENPQVEVKEVDVPELNPKIMAYKIANMLQRGMHFRRVAYTALRRIMGAGAQGVEVTISGKIRGARSACAKFTDGYIKRCGEPSTRFVREGFATVQLKPGVLGIYVRIMPPDVVLPDKVDILKPEIEEESVDQVMETLETEESAKTDIDAVEETVEKVVEDVEKVVEKAVETAEDAIESIVEEITEEAEEAEEIVQIEDTEEAEEAEEIVQIEDTEEAEEAEEIVQIEDTEEEKVETKAKEEKSSKADVKEDSTETEQTETEQDSTEDTTEKKSDKSE